MERERREKNKLLEKQHKVTFYLILGIAAH